MGSTREEMVMALFILSRVEMGVCTMTIVILMAMLIPFTPLQLVRVYSLSASVILCNLS